MQGRVLCVRSAIFDGFYHFNPAITTLLVTNLGRFLTGLLSKYFLIKQILVGCKNYEGKEQSLVAALETKTIVESVKLVVFTGLLVVLRETEAVETKLKCILVGGEDVRLLEDSLVPNFSYRRKQPLKTGARDVPSTPVVSRVLLNLPVHL